MFDTALAMSGRTESIDGPLVVALVRSGDRVRARAVYNEMLANVRSGRFSAIYVAPAASWLDGPDEALRWLERHRAERLPSLAWPHGLYTWAPVTLRDPRFASFWARMKVVPPPGT